jgi:hypothetical protein
MAAIGTVNWLAAIYLFYRSFAWSKQASEYAKYISILRVCGLIFASVALYRSVFVSSYPNRLAWFDTVFNSPFIVRSLATFAEMSFIGLIAIVLLRLNNDLKLTDNSVLRKTPDALRAAIYDIEVTRDFDRWGGVGFFIWHSGYFSICVWMSLFFMTAPRRRPA